MPSLPGLRLAIERERARQDAQWRHAREALAALPDGVAFAVPESILEAIEPPNLAESALARIGTFRLRA